MLSGNENAEHFGDFAADVYEMVWNGIFTMVVLYGSVLAIGVILLAIISPVIILGIKRDNRKRLAILPDQIRLLDEETFEILSELKPDEAISEKITYGALFLPEPIVHGYSVTAELLINEIHNHITEFKQLRALRSDLEPSLSGKYADLPFRYEALQKKLRSDLKQQKRTFQAIDEAEVHTNKSSLTLRLNVIEILLSQHARKAAPKTRKSKKRSVGESKKLNAEVKRLKSGLESDNLHPWYVHENTKRIEKRIKKMIPGVSLKRIES